MSSYFSAFPTINYNGKTIKNITLKANIIDSFRRNTNNFYSYTIKEGETPDSIAYDYYGDSNYVWIIFLVNNIIDPYYEWPLNTYELEKFIIDKYGSLQEALSTTVYYKKIPVDYYVNDITNEFILASLYNPAVNGYNWTKVTVDEDVKISSPTNPDPAVWQEVDAYVYETELNEKKRYIRLLDSTFVSAINRQLRDTING